MIGPSNCLLCNKVIHLHGLTGLFVNFGHHVMSYPDGELKLIQMEQLWC